MLQSIVEQILEKGEDAEFTELVKWCESNQNINDHETYNTLHSLHCSLWFQLSSKVQMLKNGNISATTFTYFCTCWFTKPITCDLTLKCFDKLVLLENWLHPLFDIPVTKMSQCILMDTLRALQWHVTADLFSPNRDDVWRSQVIGLLSLLRSRCAEFIRETNWDIGVLDGGDFYSQVINVEDVPETYMGYDSDDEVYGEKKRRYALETDFSLFASKKANVTSNFVFWCDNILTGIDHAIFFSAKWGLAEDVFLFDIEHVRSWLFRQMVCLDETRVCQARNDWLLKLRINEYHIRCFKLEKGFHLMLNVEHVFVTWNDNLVEEPFSSFREIETRPVLHTKENIRITTDAIFNVCVKQYIDVVQILLWTSFDAPFTSPYILRDAFMNSWIIYLSDEEQYRLPSFTHAFIHLRKIMKHKEINPIVRGVDLSILDNELQII